MLVSEKINFEMKLKGVVVAYLLLLVSCKDAAENQIYNVVKEWSGKELLFPESSVFTIYGEDTVPPIGKSDFTIVTYVDSVGCLSCRLQLEKWKSLMLYMDSVLTDRSLNFKFFLSPSSLDEARAILKRDLFDFPVCVDLKDEFNQLNHLPSEVQFRTFLLDANNRVLAVGNPVHNSKVRELYTSVILNQKVEVKPKTSVEVLNSECHLGNFDVGVTQKYVFTIVNIGRESLEVTGTDVSCGCVKVLLSCESLGVGDTLFVHGIYTAKEKESVNETVRIHCNIADSPICLYLDGFAR